MALKHFVPTVPTKPNQKDGKDMNKTIVGAVIGATVVGGLVFVLNRPEPAPPTPKERMEEAAKDMRKATQKAVEAASDAAQDAGDALASSTKATVEEMKAEVAEAFADMAEQVARTSLDTQAQMVRFLADWKATGIMTEDGIDFAAATAAVNASDLSADAKANVVAILNALRDAPGAIEEKLDALKSLLKT